MHAPVGHIKNNCDDCIFMPVWRGSSCSVSLPSLCFAPTFIRGGRLAEAARYQIPGQSQAPVGSPIDVLHQHVNTGVLPSGGELQ